MINRRMCGRICGSKWNEVYAALLHTCGMVESVSHDLAMR